MLAAVPFMLVFRFLHIVAGVLRVGSVFCSSGSSGRRRLRWDCPRGRCSPRP